MPEYLAGGHPVLRFIKNPPQAVLKSVFMQRTMKVIVPVIIVKVNALPYAPYGVRWEQSLQKKDNPMDNDLCLGGKILKIDLSNKLITTEPTQNYSDRFLGGIGINLWHLLADLEKDVAAFDPENVIAFGAGTLTGTLAPTACRVVVNSKNIFTGGLGSASAGGFFSSVLKYAGYDNIIVSGKSEKPAYLYIHNDSVSIEDASFVWGRSTWETEERLGKHLSDRQLEILSIGPAGENQVPAANVVVNRSRSASRCGLGAVMGSKNLKAIVVKGTGGIKVADPQGFMEACREMTQKILKTETTRKLREYGTPISFAKWNEQSALPTLNFQSTQMDLDKAQGLSVDILKQNHIQKNFGCFACPMHCSQYLATTEGPYAGTSGEKIECQNLWDFGTKLGIDNLAAIIKASAICFELGLDINNATGAISWAFECYQKGILTDEDTDGLQLSWGDHEVVIALLKKIAHKQGFGALLAKGSREAAQIIGKGSEQFAIHIKGQELAEELRAFKAWALGITVAERGGAHTTGAPLTERMDISESLSLELFGVRTASIPDTYEGKAQLVVYYQRFHAVLEALGICFFSSNWMGPHMLGPKDYTLLYNVATGKNMTEQELMKMGEKIHTMSRVFNLRNTDDGREADFPPERLLVTPSTGTKSGMRLDRTQWSAMLDEYYELHGWDKQSGRPHQKTLAELDLAELADS
jgi:aldehyde:ferredoxin oxidoreductase